MPALAPHIARRFDLDYVGICLPAADGTWECTRRPAVDRVPPAVLCRPRRSRARARVRRARAHVLPAIASSTSTDTQMRLVPLRLGDKAIGLLAAPAGAIEPGTLDALAGVVGHCDRARAVPRGSQGRRARAAERGAEVGAARLARARSENAADGHPRRRRQSAGDMAQRDQRREQSEIVLARSRRLSRLFESILDMARIDAGAVAGTREWVHPAEIVDAARAQVEHALKDHPIDVETSRTISSTLDPRLTVVRARASARERRRPTRPPVAPITVDGRDADEG